MERGQLVLKWKLVILWEGYILWNCLWCWFSSHIVKLLLSMLRAKPVHRIMAASVQWSSLSTPSKAASFTNWEMRVSILKSYLLLAGWGSLIASTVVTNEMITTAVQIKFPHWIVAMCFFSSVHLFSYLLFYFYFYVFFVSFFVRDVILHPIRIVNPFIYMDVSQWMYRLLENNF